MAEEMLSQRKFSSLHLGLLEHCLRALDLHIRSSVTAILEKPHVGTVVDSPGKAQPSSLYSITHISKAVSVSPPPQAHPQADYPQVTSVNALWSTKIDQGNKQKKRNGQLILAQILDPQNYGTQ